MTPGRPWNLGAKANAFSAGISRIFLTGLPRRPKNSTKGLDFAGSGAELLNAGRIAVNYKQADFTEGALGSGHGWGGAENTDQAPQR